MATNQILREKSDFTFSFYTTQDLDSNITVGVTFPRQFEIFLTEGTADTTCSFVYYDESLNSSNVTTSIKLGNSPCSN